MSLEDGKKLELLQIIYNYLSKNGYHKAAKKLKLPSSQPLPFEHVVSLQDIYSFWAKAPENVKKRKSKEGDHSPSKKAHVCDPRSSSETLEDEEQEKDTAHTKKTSKEGARVFGKTTPTQDLGKKLKQSSKASDADSSSEDDLSEKVKVSASDAKPVSLKSSPASTSKTTLKKSTPPKVSTVASSKSGLFAKTSNVPVKKPTECSKKAESSESDSSDSESEEEAQAVKGAGSTGTKIKPIGMLKGSSVTESFESPVRTTPGLSKVSSSAKQINLITKKKGETQRSESLESEDERLAWNISSIPKLDLQSRTPNKEVNSNLVAKSLSFLPTPKQATQTQTALKSTEKKKKSSKTDASNSSKSDDNSPVKKCLSVSKGETLVESSPKQVCIKKTQLVSGKSAKPSPVQASDEGSSDSDSSSSSQSSQKFLGNSKASSYPEINTKQSSAKKATFDTPTKQSPSLTKTPLKTAVVKNGDSSDSDSNDESSSEIETPLQLLNKPSNSKIKGKNAASLASKTCTPNLSQTSEKTAGRGRKKEQEEEKGSDSDSSNSSDSITKLSLQTLITPSKARFESKTAAYTKTTHDATLNNFKKAMPNQAKNPVKVPMAKEKPDRSDSKTSESDESSIDESAARNVFIPALNVSPSTPASEVKQSRSGSVSKLTASESNSDSDDPSKEDENSQMLLQSEVKSATQVLKIHSKTLKSVQPSPRSDSKVTQAKTLNANQARAVTKITSKNKTVAKSAGTKNVDLFTTAECERNSGSDDFQELYSESPQVLQEKRELVARILKQHKMEIKALHSKDKKTKASVAHTAIKNKLSAKPARPLEKNGNGSVSDSIITDIKKVATPKRTYSDSDSSEDNVFPSTPLPVTQKSHIKERASFVKSQLSTDNDSEHVETKKNKKEASQFRPSKESSLEEVRERKRKAPASSNEKKSSGKKDKKGKDKTDKTSKLVKKLKPSPAAEKERVVLSRESDLSDESDFESTPTTITQKSSTKKSEKKLLIKKRGDVDNANGNRTKKCISVQELLSLGNHQLSYSNSDSDDAEDTTAIKALLGKKAASVAKPIEESSFDEGEESAPSGVKKSSGKKEKKDKEETEKKPKLAKTLQLMNDDTSSITHSSKKSSPAPEKEESVLSKKKIKKKKKIKATPYPSAPRVVHDSPALVGASPVLSLGKHKKKKKSSKSKLEDSI
ncbi:nucleolar protein dao-5-like isoform X2 [Erpetoichthys calabaricus]|uniref:nucleolar protein dao-5-like isoform X2 n=1 Tax=Erpetoichthys calabaricus TaxID=27687 RepID=UPI0022346F24|nr:nucleolar protein dao-5-like isoform X2 [Erpetoichthys calabaricus]